MLTAHWAGNFKYLKILEFNISPHQKIIGSKEKSKMVVAIVSAVLSFIPAIITGKCTAAGWGILCYFVSLVAGFVGFHIGKFLNTFVGDRFIVTDGGFMSLVTKKFNALYGPQIAGFLIGLFLPVILIGKAGLNHSQSVVEAKTQTAIEEIVTKQIDDLDVAYLKGKEFYFAAENTPMAQNYKDKFSKLSFSVQNFGFEKKFVSKSLYGKIMGKDGISGLEPYEKFTWYEALVFCNKLSIAQKKEPCYSIKDSTDPDDWGAIPKENSFAWDSVKCNYDADGYRIPTVKEWCYAIYGVYDNTLTSLYGNDAWYYIPHYLDIALPNGDEELLWDWYTTDSSQYEIQSDGDVRCCVGLNDKREIVIEKASSSSGYKLRIVRNVNEDEIKNANQPLQDFDISKYGINMILVEGGEFECGGDKENQLPRHAVNVQDFYMSSTVVTRTIDTLYEKVDQEYLLRPNEKQFTRAIQLCNYLSMKSGLKPCYKFLRESYYGEIEFDKTANGYRLPLEEEWEYAAKGGKNKESFRWSGSDDIDEVAWYKGNVSEYAHPDVATKKANSLGFYDMSGLCNEWVWTDNERYVLRLGSVKHDYKDFDVLTRKSVSSADGAGFRLARNK